MIPAARILSEFSFYYLLVRLLPLGLTRDAMLEAMAFSALALYLAGWAGKKNLLRCLCALIPPAALLLPMGMAARLCIAPAALYAAALILGNRIYPDSWVYAKHLKLSLIFDLILVSMGLSFRPGLAGEYLIFGTGYFLFGVYFQHQLRLGAGVSLGSKLRDLAFVSALPLGLDGLVALGFWGREIVAAVVRGFLNLIGLVFFGFQGLLSLLIRASQPIFSHPEYVTTPSTEPVTQEVMEETAELAQKMPWKDVEVPRNFTLMPVLVLALIGLLIYLLTKIRKPAPPGERTEIFAEAEGTVTDTPTPRRHRDTSNRRKVRRIYTAYLRFMESKGLFRRRSETSGELLEESAALVQTENAAALREIYIRARYRMDSPVTADDVREADRLLREIKK